MYVRERKDAVDAVEVVFVSLEIRFLGNNKYKQHLLTCCLLCFYLNRFKQHLFFWKIDPSKTTVVYFPLSGTKALP